MSAWPARLRDLRDCKSARLRHSSRPPTLAATPRLRCINICRTPVVDWIGFQRLIPNPVHDNATTANALNPHPAGKGGIRGSRTPLTSCAAGHITNSTAIHGPNPISTANLRISPRVVVTAANSHRPHPVGNSGILRFFDYRRSVAQPRTHRFQCSPRPESDFGVRFPNQPTETGGSAADAIRINPETAESCGSWTMTSQPPNRPQSRSRTKPNLDGQSPNQSTGQRPLQQTTTTRNQPKTAESRGSLIIADQLHSRAHIDSSVLLDPNPISVFDFRINPRKQAVRQTASIRTHPRTAESRGSQTMTSQPPNRPRPRIRTQSNPDGQSPNWSTTVVPTADDQHLHPAGNSGIPMLSESGQSGTQPIPQPR